MNPDLMSQGAMPVRQMDFPNPRIRPPMDLTWISNFNRTTVLIPAPFFSQDWPNPRGPLQPIENLTYIRTLNPNLIGKDVLPVRNTDFPNPRGREFPVEDRTWIQNLNCTFLVIPPPGPLGFVMMNYDFPNPRGREFPVDLRSWSQSPWMNPVAGPLGVLGMNYDFPNPAGRVPAVELRTWNQSLLLDTLLTVGPLGFVSMQQDWPNPVLRQARPQLYEQGSPFLTRVSVGPLGILSMVPEFPVPRSPQANVALLSWNQSLLQTTLTPVLPAGPLGLLSMNTDFPNPIVQRSVPQSQLWLWNSGMQVITPVSASMMLKDYSPNVVSLSDSTVATTKLTDQ